MSGLKIPDLSFCETVSGSQVQGGLSEGLQPELDMLDWLTKNIPEFEKQSSENTEEYLLERFGDKKGANYGYRAFSKDGKKIIGGASGSTDKANYAVSFSRQST